MLMTPPTAPSPYSTAPLLPRVISIRSMLSTVDGAEIEARQIESFSRRPLIRISVLDGAGDAEAAHVDRGAGAVDAAVTGSDVCTPGFARQNVR